MIPDKIYVHEISAEELTENLPYHICYIRKDALLEWLKAVKADPMIPMNIDKVIEKIEAL